VTLGRGSACKPRQWSHPESISFLPPITGRPKSNAAFFWFFFGAAQPKKNPAGRAEKNMEER
ncbi:hypothetical protein MRX56_17190, partial [Pseudodesulfovibrio sp. S3-i]|uniref:hypothetical protein n=1 Tax=Pseudodesulfovibrio sp. S3-i TaxID=2929474 RepID=UPI001FBA1C01